MRRQRRRRHTIQSCTGSGSG